MPRLTLEKRSELLTEYAAGATAKQCSEKYGISFGSACSLVKRHGIARPMFKPRTHALNEAAFDEPGDERDYWVGFMMADGCCSSRRWEITLQLKASDQRHVVKFRSFLGSGHSLRRCRPATPRAEGLVGLNIHSRRLHVALGTFGVIPRKTHVAKVIGIETSAAFWRGVVDGDGTVMLVVNQGYETPIVSLVSASFVLAEQFRDFVYSRVPGCTATVRPKNRGVHSIAVTGRYAIALIRILYPATAVALPRKRAIAQAILVKADADPMWRHRQQSEEATRQMAIGVKAWWTVPENRARQSASHKGIGLGRKRPPELIRQWALKRRKLRGREQEVISAYQGGQSITDICRSIPASARSVRQVLIDAGIPRKHGSEMRAGRPMPQETRRKLSEAHKRRVAQFGPHGCCLAKQAKCAKAAAGDSLVRDG